MGFRHRLPRLACALAAAAGAAANAAPPAADDSQRVEVTADLTSVESHPYADLLKAMTDFDTWQAAHPGTRLRFRVQARRDAAVADGLQLVVADPVTRVRTPVTLEPGGRFTLPQSADWREHDAVVRSNRPDGSLAWSLEVTHEGDDAHERRLGDLREECRLDLYAAVLARGIKPPAFYAMKAVMDICTSRLIGWGTYADHPVFAVHAQDGSRRQSLRGDLLHGGEQSIMPLAPLLDWPYLLRDRTYFVHELMTDATWSDAAVLHFVFADDPPDDAAPAAEGAAP